MELHKLRSKRTATGMPKGRKRIITSLTTSPPVMHMPVHDGDHNDVARTLVHGLS